MEKLTAAGDKQVPNGGLGNATTENEDSRVQTNASGEGGIYHGITWSRIEALNQRASECLHGV